MSRERVRNRTGTISERTSFTGGAAVEFTEWPAAEATRQRREGGGGGGRLSAPPPPAMQLCVAGQGASCFCCGLPFWREIPRQWTGQSVEQKEREGGKSNGSRAAVTKAFWQKPTPTDSTHWAKIPLHWTCPSFDSLRVRAIESLISSSWPRPNFPQVIFYASTRGHCMHRRLCC